MKSLSKILVPNSKAHPTIIEDRDDIIKADMYDNGLVVIYCLDGSFEIELRPQTTPVCCKGKYITDDITGELILVLWVEPV